MSFLFTQIEIATFHRALLFLIMSHKTAFVATNKPMNIILQIAQGLVAWRYVATSQNFLFG